MHLLLVVEELVALQETLLVLADFTVAVAEAEA
jgi:hypothetical protein